MHLEVDRHASVLWANNNNQRWAFTLSNAGARYFEDRSDLRRLNEIDWDAVKAKQWSGSGISPLVKEDKQAEFLVEHRFPWHLVERIGVLSAGIYKKVTDVLPKADHRPQVELKQDWYY